MKKVLALMLALVLVLFLAACGSSGENKDDTSAEALETAETTTDQLVYKIGDTVNSELYDFTVKSASFIDSIEGGIETTTYFSDESITKEYNAYPKDGYSIVKIDLTIGYHGKYRNTLSLGGLYLNYDDGGLKFFPRDSQVDTTQIDPVPSEAENASITFKYNKDSDFDVDISDPDAFKPVDRTFYFFVDKEVETETSNSLSLEFELPTKNDSEIVSFDLR